MRHRKSARILVLLMTGESMTSYIWLKAAARAWATSGKGQSHKRCEVVNVFMLQRQHWGCGEGWVSLADFHWRLCEKSLSYSMFRANRYILYGETIFDVFLSYSWLVIRAVRFHV